MAGATTAEVITVAVMAIAAEAGLIAVSVAVIAVSTEEAVFTVVMVDSMVVAGFTAVVAMLVEATEADIANQKFA
jgi:hypothetical protein